MKDLHPYTVKNCLWVVILLIFIVIAISGCSSTPVQTTKRQYCYTSQEIRKNGDNVVNSQTTVKCNDDPVEQIVVRKAGVATNCGEFTNRMMIRGQYREEKSIACQKFDGTWEVIPRPGLY